MQRERCRRCAGSELFIAPMKSPTNISVVLISFEGMVILRDSGIIAASNLFQGSAAFTFTRSDMTSRSFSYPAQKKGGDLHHPICNTVGTTSSTLYIATGLPLTSGST